MTTIKICGLTSLDDAQWAAHCGANLLGFICWPGSPRYATPKRIAEIAGALRSRGCGSRLVGVFVDQELAHVRHTAYYCGLDLVQLHGNESPDYAAALGLPYLLARRVRDVADLTGLTDYRPYAVLLDGYDPTMPGGAGRPWPWELLKQAGPRAQRVILAGGLTPENVREAMRIARPWGVDVASGVESAPGIKDPGRVAAFVRAVREEDARDSI